MAYKKGETYWYFFSELKNRGAEWYLHLTDYAVTFIGLTTNQIGSPVWSDRRTHLQPVEMFSCVGVTPKFVAAFTGNHYLALNTIAQSTPSHQTPVYDPLSKYPSSSGAVTQILLVTSCPYIHHTHTCLGTQYLFQLLQIGNR
jgi:hypothetical protein